MASEPDGVAPPALDRPLVAVVLAGGTGTRLYPAARARRPKPFLTLGADRSLLARTVDRVAFADATVVSTRVAYAGTVPKHAPDADVLVEPEPKDTGPALVYAAHTLRDRFDDPVLCCLPSDHHVTGDLESPLRRAAALAVESGDLVAIGVEPDRPMTGYGYLVPGHQLSHGGVAVDRFVEKPDAERAADLIASGALWNAGLFAWTPEALLREARESPLAPLVAALENGDVAGGFAAVEPSSVDRAVMERTNRIAAVSADIEWDDLGAWDAVGRVVDGSLAESLEIDASGNVLASDGAHITVIGASDLVVASYDDRVLVVPTGRAQEVREAVDRLRETGRF